MPVDQLSTSGRIQDGSLLIKRFLCRSSLNKRGGDLYTMQAFAEAATFSGRPVLISVRPVQPRVGRCGVVHTYAAAAVETKKQSRLAFVELQPPDPILGEPPDHFSSALSNASPQSNVFNTSCASVFLAATSQLMGTLLRENLYHP